jgi:hypothetical protein
MKHILHPVFFIGKSKLISKFQDNILEDSEREEFYKIWKIYIHKNPTPFVYIKRVSEEKRGLEYTLTKEQYEYLIYKACYLCGYKNIVGNGLDRQDHSKSYNIDNVLPCCSTCNMMKAFYNKDDFIKQIKKISDFKKEYPAEWNNIPCKGFQMGAAKTEEIKETKDKQWRAVSIYKAVKSDCLEEFKIKTIKTTKWSETEFEDYKIKNKIGNIYIGPPYKKHRVNILKPFNGQRITIAFDVISENEIDTVYKKHGKLDINTGYIPIVI